MKGTNSYNIGLVGVLTLIFIALKLCKLITWSWWWVLSPLWMSVVFTIIVLNLIILFGIIIQILKK